MPKNKYKNIWFDEHPVINYATFEAFYEPVFGHDCILEHYQDGEIWSDEEYWGSVLYDFTDNVYFTFPTYVHLKDCEEIISHWRADGKYKNDGIITKDFDSDYNIEAINFYKEYLKTNKKQDIEDYYKKVYADKE